MTISNSANSVTLGGNGVTFSFGFSFVGVAATDITVTYTDASGNQTVLLTAQYTLALNAPVTGEIWGVGGAVTYPLSGSPIASGTTITIERTLPLTQEVEIDNQGGFYPEVIEEALDTLCMEIQQVDAVTSRSIQIPVVDEDINVILPAAASRANQFVAFDGSGNVIASTGSGSSPISAAMAPVVAAATTAQALALLGGSSFSVNTIVELRALAAGSSDIIFVASYATLADGGGGFFLWSSGSTAADDGGFVIIPNSLPASGRWIRDEKNVITPIMFGLQAESGTGTDSTPTFNKMIAASLTYTIRTLLFLGGGYHFNTQPNPVTSGMTIAGTGLVNTVLYKNFNNGYLIGFNTYGGNTVSDIALDAISTASGGVMLYGYAVDADHAPNGLILQNLYISPLGTNNYRYGIYLDGSARTNAPEGIRDVKMVNVDVFGAEVAPVFLGSIQGLSWNGGATYAAGGTGTDSIVITGTVAVNTNLVNINVTSIGGNVSCDHAHDVIIAAATIAGDISTSSTASNITVQGRVTGTVGSVARMVPGYFQRTVVYDPPNLADGAGTTTTVTVTGALLGDDASATTFNVDLQGITMTSYVSAADTVSVRFQNESGGAINLVSGNLTARVAKFQ